VGCGSDAPSFGDVIAYYGVPVNCGGPPDSDAGFLYYRDDGVHTNDSDDFYAEAVFESIGGTPLKLSGAAPVTDGSGNPALSIYGTARTGADFTYKFSIKPGVYRVILQFAEIGSAQHAGDRVFSFQIEDGGTIFNLPDGSNSAYDIVAKAGGRLIAHDEEVDITATHTVLTIHFLAGSGPDSDALINAIEVLLVEAIVVNPPTATLLAGQTKQFTAVAPPGPQVNWAVTSPLGSPGTIDANGVYTAPSTFSPPTQETVVASILSEDTATLVTGSATTTLYQPIDTNTRGKFAGVYGRDGYILANTPATDGTPPAYVQNFAVSSSDGAGTVNVFTDGLVAGALDPDGTGTRPAIMWNDVDGTHGLQFSFTLNDAQPHLFGIYCLDFDGQGRKQHFEMVPLDGGPTQSLDFAIGGGVYLFWIASGRIQINVTKAAGSTGINNIVNGVFFR
jgi:hypothetical protein